MSLPGAAGRGKRAVLPALPCPGRRFPTGFQQLSTWFSTGVKFCGKKRIDSDGTGSCPVINRVWKTLFPVYGVEKVLNSVKMSWSDRKHLITACGRSCLAAARVRVLVPTGNQFNTAPLLRSPQGEAKEESCRAARRANTSCPEYRNFLRCVPHLCRLSLPPCPFPGGSRGAEPH